MATAPRRSAAGACSRRIARFRSCSRGRRAAGPRSLSHSEVVEGVGAIDSLPKLLALAAACRSNRSDVSIRGIHATVPRQKSTIERPYSRRLQRDIAGAGQMRCADSSPYRPRKPEYRRCQARSGCALLRRTGWPINRRPVRNIGAPRPDAVVTAPCPARALAPDAAGASYLVEQHSAASSDSPLAGSPSVLCRIERQCAVPSAASRWSTAAGVHAFDSRCDHLFGFVVLADMSKYRASVATLSASSVKRAC